MKNATAPCLIMMIAGNAYNAARVIAINSESIMIRSRRFNVVQYMINDHVHCQVSPALKAWRYIVRPGHAS